MFNARALLAALLGLTTHGNDTPPFNILPRPYDGQRGKAHRRVDHGRIRAKERHHEYSGAKLARKAILGEIGIAHPR